jgi:thioredoxin-like negative regulator of GroEL
MPRRFRPGFAGLLLLAGAATAVSGLRWKNETLVHAAMNAHRVQDWPALIAACGRLDAWICDVNPASSPMAWQEGIAKYRLGDVAGAERSFRAALRVHPAHAHALYDLSVCRLAAGDAAGAETLLRRTLDVSPGLPEAALNLAVLSLRRGDHGLARTALDGVGAARRDSKWRRLDRATALEERNSR